MILCGLHPLKTIVAPRLSPFFVTTRTAYGKKKLVAVLDRYGNLRHVDIRDAGKKKYRRVIAGDNMSDTPGKPAGKGADGKGKLRGRSADSLDVQVSKTVAWLLRHGAQSQGLHMRPDGYVRVTDLMRSQKLHSIIDFPTLQDIVKRDQKQRYTLLYEPDSTPGSTETVWWIRANQGHSMKSVSVELQPITSAKDIRMAVHGTTWEAWQSIKTQGLSKMSRNHIHLAQGVAGHNVISGMRRSSEILIYIDIQKALDAGIQFGLSSNGVVLTTGDDRGFLSSQFFKRVEDSMRVPLPGWEGSPNVMKEADESDIPEKNELTVELPADKAEDGTMIEKLDGLELK